MLRFGGPLEPQFREVAPVLVYEEPMYDMPLAARVARVVGTYVDEEDLRRRRLPERALRRGARAINQRRTKRRLAVLGDYDLIYANSTGSSELIDAFPAGPPIVTHVHELEYQMLHAESTTQIRRLVDRTDRFIAASHAAAGALGRVFGVKPDRVDVCHEFVETQLPPPAEEDVASVRAALNIKPGTFVVGGAGSVHWRKGTDLFLLLAMAVRRRLPTKDIAFIWVGGPIPSPHEMMEYDRDMMGLSSVVHFVGVQDDPRPFFQTFDVVALTSRSDTFPLVCLECAALGKPIISFQNGGIGEFIENDAGVVVPYADIDSMAETLVELHQNPDRRSAMGGTALAKVRARNDVEAGAAQIAAIIRRVAESKH